MWTFTIKIFDIYLSTRVYNLRARVGEIGLSTRVHSLDNTLVRFFCYCLSSYFCPTCIKNVYGENTADVHVSYKASIVVLTWHQTTFTTTASWARRSALTCSATCCSHLTRTIVSTTSVTSWAVSCRGSSRHRSSTT